MTQPTHCEHCGHELTGYRIRPYGKAKLTPRTDKHFCSDRCTAAYHREHAPPEIHAYLKRATGVKCVVCGKRYKINDYADRGGLRQPLYCSPACKQRAYRARKKLEREAQKSKPGAKVRHAPQGGWVCQNPECGQIQFVDPNAGTCDFCGHSEWVPT